MGTKLAEMAGTDKLRGKVVVTNAKGVTMTYEDEAAAWEACKGMNLEHRRGAFFECGKAKASAPKAAPEPEPEVAEESSEDDSSGSGSRRRRNRR